MEKFDPDFAMFGIITADLENITDVGSARIGYANDVAGLLYGTLEGRSIRDIVCEVAGETHDADQLVNELNTGGAITVEGRLNNRFVKFHSRVVQYCDDESCGIQRLVQAGIMDITESEVLKSLLYGTSEALKRAAEAADEDTGSHVARINIYSKRLAELYGLEQGFIDDVSNYAQLHDIGKIRVAEIIRLPRKLNNDEFVEMQRHTIYGASMVEGLAGLSMAHDIILDHHEKWNGSGYPHGKKGKEISLAGRIVALADVFDALVSERPYKPAFSYDDTRKVMGVGDERVMPDHFDPELLELFLDKFAEFVELHKNMNN